MDRSERDFDILHQLQNLAVLQAETNTLLKSHLKDYDSLKKDIEETSSHVDKHTLYFKACFWAAGLLVTVGLGKYITH